jgi:hypothetical protein
LSESIFAGTRILSLDLETTDFIKKGHIRELGVAEYIDGEYVRGASALFSGGVCSPGALRQDGSW